MALRIVDQNETHVVQKITDNKGKTLHFQTIEKARLGKMQADIHATLELARNAIGKTGVAETTETAPKGDYPEQQKGYSRK